MNRTHHRIALLALAVSCCQAATAQDKKLYCWNEGGQRICGDALPADAAARARTEINAKSGLRSEVERALTDAERQAAAAAAKQAGLAAESEQARVRRDLAMVTSYATEADLRRAYGERLVLVEESIKASVLGEANLRSSLVGLLKQAADNELIGQPVAKPLQDGIATQRAELDKQLQILAAQHDERASLNGDLELALERYRKLKALKPGETVAVTTPEP